MVINCGLRVHFKFIDLLTFTILFLKCFDIYQQCPCYVHYYFILEINLCRKENYIPSVC